MSVRRFAAPVVFLIVVMSASLLPTAQAPKPAEEPQLLLLTFAKVLPGMAREYVDLQTKEVMPAQKKGGLAGRQAFSSGLSGPAGEFVFVTPISSFARFDSPAPVVQALGEEGAAALGAKLAKVSEPKGTSIIRTRPDLSYIPDPKAPQSPLGMITIVDVVPGKRVEFEALLKKDVIPAMQQAKVKAYRVSEVLYGEHTGGYISAVGYDSYEAAGKGHPFVIALGEEGARKLETKVTGLVTKLHRYFVRHRPELSWTSAAGTD